MDPNKSMQKEGLETYRKINRVVSWIIFPPLMIFSFIAIFTGHHWLISKRGVTEIDGIWARIVGGSIILMTATIAAKGHKKKNGSNL